MKIYLMKFVRVLKNLINQKGLGLVEALVALAIVGTAMILITQVSFKTLKQARKDELQDVAIQIAVEASDFLKQPGDIDAFNASSFSDTGYFSMEVESNYAGINYQVTATDEIGEDFNCENDTIYKVDVGEGYDICCQIYIDKDDTREKRYDFRVIVVWLTVGGINEKRVIEGYRYGDIDFSATVPP